MATFLLIHGSFQGGWIWQPTAKALRANGHTVYAPTMEGCAERVHALRAGLTITSAAKEMAELLRYEDLNDVVLVGTSSGGMIAAKTASLAKARMRPCRLCRRSGAAARRKHQGYRATRRCGSLRDDGVRSWTDPQRSRKPALRGTRRGAEGMGA